MKSGETMNPTYKDKLTEVWSYYEFGKQYNNAQKPNRYALAETNREFFHGNQWINLPDNDATRRLAKPVFNIIQRITSLFVASLTTSGTTISFEPLLYQDDEDAARIATAEVRNLLEKLKMEYRIRDALFDGAITGDYCAHFFWNPEAKPYGGAFGEYRGEIQMELIDGINVMFGNPAIRETEKQPYILILGSDTVENLKNEAARWRKVQRTAERFGILSGSSGDTGSPGQKTAFFRNSPGIPESGGFTGQGNGLPGTVPHGTGKKLSRDTWDDDLFADSIVPDSGGSFGDGAESRNGSALHGNDDRTNTARFLYMYEKKRRVVSVPDETAAGGCRNEVIETVFVTKVTRTAVIFSEVDTGLSRYPVAWGNWQKQNHAYHGRALVTEVIPNQIFINQMMAMVFRHLQTQAFPTKIYNADYLPQLGNEVGTAIGVRNLLPGQTPGSVISTIPSSDMSNQILQAIDLCVQYTKDCLGATDAQLGNLDATNTSALMVLQNASEIPLENMRSGLHEWVEDIGAILLDMIGTYYGKRPVLKEEEYTSPILGADGKPLIDPMTGTIALNREKRKTVISYDFTKFRKLFLNISVDVGATSYYSEIASIQTLDNLRNGGYIDIIDYLERVPDSLISRKDELLEKLRQKAGLTEMRNAGSGTGKAVPGNGDPPPAPGQSGGYTMGGAIDAQKKISMLPASIQAQYDRLPKIAQNALMKVR